jgi:nucleoside-diphosphate-sugar epimerase
MQDADAPITFYGESKIAMERVVMEMRPDAMILRPPMILGPRDRATLPLFRMAAGWIRPKPGLHPKFYSWIHVDDLVAGILQMLSGDGWSVQRNRKLYVAAPASIRDVDLVQTAASLLRRRGFLLPLPHPVLGLAARLIDAVPSLRAAAPSLTRDRVREVFPSRWVVDASDFRRSIGERSYVTLEASLAATLAWYRRTGEVEAASA